MYQLNDDTNTEMAIGESSNSRRTPTCPKCLRAKRVNRLSGHSAQRATLGTPSQRECVGNPAAVSL